MRKLVLIACYGVIYSAMASSASSDERGSRQVELQDNWLHCLLVFSQTVASATDEKAEVIADAALTSCSQEEAAVYDFYTKQSNPLLAELGAQIFPDVKENYRKEAIAKVLVVRTTDRLNR